MVKNLYGSLTWKFQTVLRSLQKLLEFINFFQNLLCVHMVFWKANKAYSALLLLDGDLHSSPQCVIIHGSSNPWWETSTVACILCCDNTALTLLCWELRSSRSVGKGSQYLHSKAFSGLSKFSECPVINWRVRSLSFQYSFSSCFIFLRFSVWIL